MEIHKNYLGRGYKTDRFLTLLTTPAGEVVFSLLKSYSLGLIFNHFKNPILISSPVIQKKLISSKEQIKLSEKAILRSTSHDFYFDLLEHTNPNLNLFPLEFVEQSSFFREEGRSLEIFSRQTSFVATELHAFCKDRAQVMGEIKTAIRAIKEMQQDLSLKYYVICHLKTCKKTDFISFLENEWGEELKIQYDPQEEMDVSLDFLVCLQNGKTIEVSGLELLKVKLNSNFYLVDFTVGGVERMISAVWNFNNGRPPIWLSPIQIAVIGKKHEIVGKGLKPPARVLFLENEQELNEISQKIYIPFVVTQNSSQGQISKIIKKIQQNTPNWLREPYFHTLSSKSIRYFLLSSF